MTQAVFPSEDTHAGSGTAARAADMGSAAVAGRTPTQRGPSVPGPTPNPTGYQNTTYECMHGAR
jgi:hypothetical protein